MGVSEINERGVVHDGVEYPLDVLIYATGFQWMATSTFNMIVGRGGRTLSEKWQTEGTKTFLGLHSQGFPNLFIVTGPAGRRRQLQLHRRHRHPRRLRRLDAARRCGTQGDRRSSTSTTEPEEEYAEHCREADIATAPLRDCLSYYNGHGEAAPGSLAYYGGRRGRGSAAGAGDDGAVRVRPQADVRRSGTPRGVDASCTAGLPDRRRSVRFPSLDERLRSANRHPIAVAGSGRGSG